MQAKAFSAQFRAERADLEGQLSRYTELLGTARTNCDSRSAAAIRKSIRLTEDDLRRIDRMLEAIERRFPEAFSR